MPADLPQRERGLAAPTLFVLLDDLSAYVFMLSENRLCIQ